MELLTDFAWLVIALASLAWLQIQLHREIQYLFLLITRSYKFTIVLFSLVFLPGVFLHEISHFLMAKLLHVQTGQISVFPRKMDDGRLQLGFVEVAVADPVRESLIGAAPLLSGSVFVGYAGLSHLGLDSIWVGLMQHGWGAGLDEFIKLFEKPDVWLWLYLALAVSSTMFPSESDRKPMFKIFLAVAILIGVLLLFGVGYWILNMVGSGLTRVLGSVAAIFGISASLHLLLLVPLKLTRWLIQNLIGVRVRAV